MMVISPTASRSAAKELLLLVDLLVAPQSVVKGLWPNCPALQGYAEVDEVVRLLQKVGV